MSKNKDDKLEVFEVEVKTIAIVLARDAKHASEVAKTYHKDICNDDPAPTIVVTGKVSSSSKLEHGWDKNCIPYGGNGDKRLKEIFEKIETEKGKTLKIISARISDMPKSFAEPMPAIYAITEDNVEHKLFSYYPDEISFTTDEFLGLTLEQAGLLFHKKDVAYLQSP